MMFNIIIPMYNVEGWIPHNVDMLKKQTHQYFRCRIVNDMSTDRTFEAAEKAITGDPRFELINNTERKCALKNIYESINALNLEDEDVIVLIDGDDRLLHSRALERVASAYESDECWMTYGSHENEQGRRGKDCKPYPDKVLETGTIRKYDFRAAHPRTFRAKLWQKIKENAFCATQQEINTVRIKALLKGKIRAWHYWQNIELSDIHDPSGKFFRRCYDKTILFPMFEMAGRHAVFIEEPTYLYRDSGIPLPYVTKTENAKWITRLIRAVVFSKPSYKHL